MPPPLGRGDSLGYKKGTILKDGRYKVEREVNSEYGLRGGCSHEPPCLPVVQP